MQKKPGRDDRPGLRAKQKEPKRMKEIMKESEKLQLPNVTLCAMTSVQVRAAVKAGEIPKSRHDSYVRLYEQAKQIPDWERD